MSKRKRWIAIVLVVSAVALGSRAFQNQPEGRWLPVERRDLVIGVPLEGELSATRSTALGPPPVQDIWNFKISYLATDGKDVKQGQPVIRFDTSELQLDLQKKSSERDSAEKELEKLITDLKIERRNLELRLSEAKAALRRADFNINVPDDVIAANELKTALIEQRMARLEIDHVQKNLEFMDSREKSQIGNLEQRRQRAAAEVEELQKSIAGMTVIAPRDGTVMIETDHRQQKFKVGDQVWRAFKVLQIPDLTSMQIEAKIAEADAGRLSAGQAVTFRLDAHLDREYTGKIESIRRTVQRKSRTSPEKIVKAVIAVDETDTERMRPGMRLRGTIEIERIPDTVVVPQEALFTDSDGAWVWQGGLLSPKKVEPELGPRNGRYFQVLSGLEPGDTVLVQERGDEP